MNSIIDHELLMNINYAFMSENRTKSSKKIKHDDSKHIKAIILNWIKTRWNLICEVDKTKRDFILFWERIFTL